ncbi:MAG TPA: hypothetical protein VJP86_10780 [Vicinamibacterales bacterium]|nr:hypothetical protein [Vicinamibacterales bacterium]
MIGRGLAISTHPSIAWRILSPSRRALLVFGYFAASYLVVLGGLFSF